MTFAFGAKTLPSIVFEPEIVKSETFGKFQMIYCIAPPVLLGFTSQLKDAPVLTLMMSGLLAEGVNFEVSPEILLSSLPVMFSIRGPEPKPLSFIYTSPEKLDGSPFAFVTLTFFWQPANPFELFDNVLKASLKSTKPPWHTGLFKELTAPPGKPLAEVLICMYGGLL